MFDMNTEAQPSETDKKLQNESFEYPVDNTSIFYSRRGTHTSKPEQAEAEKPPMVFIKGQEFRFPVKKMKVAVEHGVADEKNRRVFKGLDGRSWSSWYP